MPSPFASILKRLENMSNGIYYGSKISVVDGHFYIANGHRPYRWQRADKCLECGRIIKEGDMAHWDEINAEIICGDCHGS